MSASLSARLSSASTSTTVVTSNKLFEEWGAVFPDKILAGAIIDRLVHHCHPIVIKGESFRVKEHLRQKTGATAA